MPGCLSSQNAVRVNCEVAFSGGKNGKNYARDGKGESGYVWDHEHLYWRQRGTFDGTVEEGSGYFSLFKKTCTILEV